MSTAQSNVASIFGALCVSALLASGSLAAESEHHETERQSWSFGGLTGQYDQQQLQRGFKIYEKVCANCHGLSRVRFRNLVEKGGPQFPEEAIKALAASWPNQITDGPNDDGKMFDRPAGLPDQIRGPYKNDKEARSAQNGALPPDLSLIAKARGTHHEAFWPVHVGLMAVDIVKNYQEGGPDYLYGLLTGYKDAPADVKMADGMYYNAGFPGHQIAMPPPLSPENLVAYEDNAGATASVEQNAKDITAFLAWASDPTLNQRKTIGWQVMLYLLVTTVLLYLGKKRIWSKIPH